MRRWTVTVTPLASVMLALALSACAAPAARVMTPAAPPTATSAPTASPSPPPDVLSDAELLATLTAAGTPDIQSMPSPDGRWRAEVVRTACVPVGGDRVGSLAVRLVETAGGAARQVEGGLLYCGGIGAAGFSLRFWSKDSRYFFYTPSGGSPPDGCGYWTGYGGDFTRVEAATLANDRMVSGQVSPDGGHIAGWQPTAGDIVVWDLTSGETLRRRAALDETPGPLAWSPGPGEAGDGRSLIVVQNADYCPLSGPSSVYRLDLPGFKQTMLLAADPHGWASVSWDKPGLIRLVDQVGKSWDYQLGSGRLTETPPGELP